MQKLTCKISRTDRNPYWSDSHFGASHFRFTLSNGKESFSSFYSQGAGIKKNPTGEDILHALLMDRSCFTCSSGFEDFCSSLGYESNSPDAREIFNGCRKAARALEPILENIEKVEEAAFEDEVEGLKKVVDMTTKRDF